MQAETLKYDVVIVGAGVSGLATAIRLKQLCADSNTDLSICVLEKGASVGAHILSGAVIEPTALSELLPDWQNRQPPKMTAVNQERFFYLSERHAWRLPTPRTLNNKGNYITSLGQLCRWLADLAESLGIDIFPGFAAAELLINEKNTVYGIRTGDMGRNRHGEPGTHFQAGIAIHARSLVLAEGARGSLSKQVIARYRLDANSSPQTYAIGLKELWQVDNTHYSPGLVLHTVGWPLDQRTYGGSFLYHAADNTLALGFVIGLDYENPYLQPHEELQRFKTHPKIAPYLEKGERLCYGARALTEGGWQSIPQCHFPGGVLVGCAAGFMNVAKIKGSHTAMKSGMLAAETLFTSLQHNIDFSAYDQTLRHSWIAKELRAVRNIRPGFQHGLLFGLLNAGVESYLLRGMAPWTLAHRQDHRQLKNKNHFQAIHYPKPDNQLTFDRLTSLSFSNVGHEEDQVCHLHLQQPEQALTLNWQQYASPETRYCPAGVYEIINPVNGKPYLQINAQNCLHCKTCDIKDPGENINWLPPEGGGGPNYYDM